MRSMPTCAPNRAADIAIARGIPADAVSRALAAHPEADYPHRSHDDLFRGFIDTRGHNLSRRALTRLRRRGYLPVMAGGQSNGGAPAGVVAMLPFTSAAHEMVQPAFTVTGTPGAAEVAINPQDIPAAGYLRHVLLQVDSAGGSGGTGNADFPFNLISSLTFSEVNGSNIVGGTGFNGWDLFLTNLIGGYAWKQDPRELPAYVGTAPNPVFTLRIPAEISSKDGLGALVNQNASALFKLLMSIGTVASMTSVAFTTAPTATIRAWLEGWTLPASTDSRGRPQSQVPPLVGTAQYWSKRSQAVAVGQNTIPHTRLGNLFRNLVYVARDASGVRADTVFPDPFSWSWDGNQIMMNVSQRYAKQFLWEKINTAQAALAGVYALPYSHGDDGKTGNEDPNLWFGTTAASRVEITGVSAAAGTVYVYTNEVAPVEADPGAQYQVPNQTGALLQPASVQAAR